MDSASQSIAAMSAADVFDVREVAEHARHLGRVSRRRAVGAWFPLLCGGSATLASLGVESMSGYAGLTPYWAIAAPAVGAACALFYALRRVQPPDRTSRWAVAVSLALFGAMAGVRLLLGPSSVPSPSDLTPALFVGALLVVLGALYRHVITAATGLAVMVATTMVMLVFPDHPYTWVALTVGAAMAVGSAASVLVVD